MIGLRRGLGSVLAVIIAIALLVVLRPWTIRPIQSAKPTAFDAESYVQTAWSEVMREAERTATDAIAAEPPPAETRAGTGGLAKARFLRGTAVVTAVDRQSRVGLALLRLDHATSSAVALQIGPVLRGTAVRDAATFIRFSDFANQSDFAAVANALNNRILETVLGPIDVAALSGRTVSFVGAAGAPREGGPLEIVPLSLQIAGGGR